MKRILYLMMVFVLICGLFGCSDISTTADEPTTAEQITSEPQTTEPTEAPSTEAPTTEAPTTQPPATEPAEPTVYLYDELGFRLTFPAHWEGRYTVESSAESNSVTISADSLPVLTLVAVPNAPGAYERSMELYADGYEFFNENFVCSYFVKFLAEFPDDLSWHMTGIVGLDPEVFQDLVQLFSYVSEIDPVIPCKSETPQGIVERLWYNNVLIPTGSPTTYYNYRLGIKLNIPEEFVDAYQIIVGESVISLSLNDRHPTVPEDDVRNLLFIDVYNSEVGHVHTNYPADADPYPLMNEQYGYEAYRFVGEYESCKYYFTTPLKPNRDEHQNKDLIPLWEYVIDNFDEIFSIIKS